MELGKEPPGRFEEPDKGKGGVPAFGAVPEDGNGHEAENEAEAQKYGRRESLSDELINGAETPEELFIGLRQLEKQLEDANIPPNLSERYTPPRQLSAMYERADMMAFSTDELLKRGWITNYDPTTGEAKVKDRRFAPLAIKTEVTERQARGFYQQEIRYYFGKDKERTNLEKAYKRAITELEARDIIGEHVGARLNLDIRDSLESLTGLMHSGRMPKFKADHLEALFNMPSLSEIGSNPENRQLGDQVEEAMFLNLVMLNSGNRQRMLDLLERPGSKHLIAKLAKEKAQEYDVWVNENIGNVDAWEDDNKRLLVDDSDIQATWRLEAAGNRRGSLTKWSNIAAWGGKSGEFGADKEAEFIEKTVGGLVGSVEASWVAASMMRAIGAYASEGYVALPNGKSLLPLGEGRYISGDDTGKFWVYMFNCKEGTKGRTSGLREMIGRFPDMAMNLFDWAQVEIKLPDGTEIRRSIWDAWLGTAGNKSIIDLLTGKETQKFTTEESYHRLGDLNFKSLEREFHGTFTIMQWLMGNAERPTGVFIDAMNEEFEPDEFKLNKEKRRWKYIDIVMNPIVLTKGSPHLYELGAITKDQIETLDLVEEGVGKIQLHTLETKTIETIKKRFMRNLNAARIRSSEFATEVMPISKKIFNTGGVGDTFLDVPYVNLVNLYLNEALKPRPSTEEELIAHYTDDLTRLQKLASWKEAGKVREKATKWLTNNVGKVTGRKTS